MRVEQKRKTLRAVIICLISTMLLAGCGASSDSKLKDETENIQKNTEAVEDDDGKGGEIAGKTPENADAETGEEADEEKDEETGGAGESGDDLDFAAAFREGRVGNNGTYFVRIRDKVYFRNIPPESMEKGATFGEFLHTEFYPMKCPLISYDVNTCEWEEIGSVAGTGELYACPKGFYIGETNAELFDASCTNLYDPVTKETSYFCRGLPLGVSESGELFAAEEFDGGNGYTVIYKDGKEKARVGEENIYYEYVGFAGEDLMAICHTDDEEWILCSIDEYGEVTELGKIGDPNGGYARAEQLLYVKGDIYLSLAYYEGTGHFLSKWEAVKATPGMKGSLKTVIDGIEESDTEYEEGPENTVPIIYFDETSTLCHSIHVPYSAYMGSGENENNLCWYNDIFEEEILVKDFINNSYEGNCSIVQNISSDFNTVFVIYADAIADSEYDIGWRLGYRMTGWHIVAIPCGYGHLDKEGHAKEIIHFENEGSGDNGKTAESNENTDPLAGLVSEDILEKFRVSDSVKNPDSIEKEAIALGGWVQKSIDKIPTDTREKGEKIGQHYEFWFGTDISNNFDENFPGIYGTYYCLKDYYTSDGKRSSDFYNRVKEENEFLGNGDPKNIEKMYTDMQGFITDCNNIIRNK